MTEVRTAGPRPLGRPRGPNLDTDRRLARLHLRMGHLGLARAELEALAGVGDLGDDGLLALAEARWRTGDLTGAGEAAQAHLNADGDSIVALVIAAEATAAVGRPGEARKLAGRALERSDAPLDRIFAGMPRSLIWPADPHEAGQPEGMLFPADVTAQSFADAEAAAVREAESYVPPAGPGFWDTDEEILGEMADPAAELEAAAAALAGGHRAGVAIRLALILRIAPELAPGVLEAIAHSATLSAELELVRGDAYKLVGEEEDAQRAFAAAAAALARRAQ
ncbi:MAG TPA: hypothetical protein VH723_04385 [Candidatus Limnocylindrales bacterium]|jgi:hypothetical protein